MHHSNLIVMLTYQDFTVQNAYQIFEECKDTAAQYWGFKDKGLPEIEMKELFNYMKSCGKTTVLEVVEYDESSSLAGAELAKACGADILMGTTYFDSVNTFCLANHITYLPFAGEVVGRPSVLKGDISQIVEQAQKLSERGVSGFDLLGYRHETTPEALIEAFVEENDLPVCVAGSIDSYDKLDFIKRVNPWAFTIGSAFFNHKFDGSFSEQIDKVVQYINQEDALPS